MLDYDPIIGRVLSPDNYVQDATNAQSYNRYSYCLNNPLKYTDPDGEWIHLLIGAAIGGTMNLLMNIGNLDKGWKGVGQGFAYFGIGALAGAASAGIGAGIGVALQGGSFGAGFVGMAQPIAGIGFFGGASASFVSSFTTVSGNSLMQGQSFENGLLNGLKQGGYSALFGGLMSGISSSMQGGNFFTGNNNQVKLDYIIKAHDKVVREKVGNKVVDNTKVELRSRWETDPISGNRFRTPPGQTFSLEELSGEKWLGIDGHLSKIQLTSETLNSYYWDHTTKASSVYVHEFFHALDNYTGMDSFMETYYGASYANDFLEYYTYQRCFNIYGTGIGPNQMNTFNYHSIRTFISNLLRFK
jgi:hypothetical protein